MTTHAGAAEFNQLPKLLHGEERELYGDQAYWSEMHRVAARERGVRYRVNRRPNPGRPLSELPPDYYAPGPGYLYARGGWAAPAMALGFQLGGPDGVGHAHQDAGSFQISFNGRWVTKESTGYGTYITGYGGSGTEAVGPLGATRVSDGIRLVNRSVHPVGDDVLLAWDVAGHTGH